MANQAPGAPQVPAPSHVGADGSVLLVFPPTHVGMQGVEFVSPYAGTWEAESDRRGHFTATQLLSDARGAFLGSVTVDGYPEVSEDGESFVDDGSRVIVTIHDVTGAIVQQLPGTGAPPVTGIPMTTGVPGFPQGTLAAGTPVAGTPTPSPSPRSEGREQSQPSLVEAQLSTPPCSTPRSTQKGDRRHGRAQGRSTCNGFGRRLRPARRNASES